MNIPQVLGYTRIAGTPVVTGLYTMLLALVAFAIFGSSSGRGGVFHHDHRTKRGDIAWKTSSRERQQRTVIRRHQQSLSQPLKTRLILSAKLDETTPARFALRL